MKHFGRTFSGTDVYQHVIGTGPLRVTILDWGAAVQDVNLAGVDHSLTLGSGRIEDYENSLCHHGTLIGPIANRISTARVTIGGMTYELERNQDNRIHLHSGKHATHRRKWDILETSASHITLVCRLVDGACGLPGNREITAAYSVDGATLTLDLVGTTDAVTLMNFANHSYWNLDGSDTWAGHKLKIAADRVLPTTDDSCPTGEICEVDGTEMDFRTLRRIEPHTIALDHNFCLSQQAEPLRSVLTLLGSSGVRMELETDQPGLQIYDGRSPARPGKQAYEGLAIEAQAWPDAPNNSSFPPIEVTPDAPYTQTTRWSFSAP